jgi:hypothetical protein
VRSFLKAIRTFPGWIRHLGFRLNLLQLVIPTVANVVLVPLKASSDGRLRTSGDGRLRTSSDDAASDA